MPQDDEPMDNSPRAHFAHPASSRKPSWPSSAGSAQDPADLHKHNSHATASASAPSAQLRTLLPARVDEPASSMQPVRKKTMVGRVQVAAACLGCRRRKVKCNGGRPTCQRCAEQGLACEYDADLDSTRMLTLKRRQVELKTEIDDLRDLFSLLQTRPEQDALEILRRIRTGPAGDVHGVVDFVRSGDLLLQGTALSTAASGLDDPQALRVDNRAAEEPYAIRVPARPWTTIAGDGLVSELVGSFFAWDSMFWLSFIDRASFITDMRAGNPAEAKYCSPLLVHAMCALRCSTSPRAKALSTILGFDIRDRFLNQAKKILDQENGRVSLPTVWALAILFICSASQGRDRAGIMYRFTAYDMLKRMRLQQRLELLQEAEDDEEASVAQRVYSRSLWGMYAFESCVAFVYLNPSAFPRPTMPRMFHDRKTGIKSINTGFVDDYPLSTAILDAACDLSDIYNEVMVYNRQAKAEGVLGSQADLERRMLHFQEVQACREALPVDIQSSRHFTPGACSLDSFADQVLLAIFRPLHHDVSLPNSSLGTAGDVCFSCCEAGILGAERVERDFQLQQQGYSVVITYPLYSAAITLVSMLEHPRVAPLFTRVCRLLAEMQDDYLLTAFCLHGVKAMAEKMGLPIPPATRPYFTDLRVGQAQLQDVPISFVLPGWDDMTEFLSHDGGIAQEEGLGVEMGMLITKWNAMSTS
ncbi:hypothetical protein F5X68DRAFT_264025 [Plectosphaerella plurivora]|uniref:Zn(2)-C6 fungal-type domain-containing protein n=1 Tax=Plectosphaerella plurivora TaxID=936078 RepID=A0A9P8V5V1_9PEZI|nr:hypothetical protein F5X68DRAFT_264025 [Plectosphaerella plurivora]